jgi:ribosome-associated translation inhibitor RaiA
MDIIVNTDNTIKNSHQGLDEYVRAEVENAIGRFGEHIRRVDVHLSNENQEKRKDGGNYCMMEARVTGYEPVVVHDHADDLHQAISNAGGKLQRALDSALGRLNAKKMHEPLPIDIDAESYKNLTSSRMT